MPWTSARISILFLEAWGQQATSVERLRSDAVDFMVHVCAFVLDCLNLRDPGWHCSCRRASRHHQRKTSHLKMQNLFSKMTRTCLLPLCSIPCVWRRLMRHLKQAILEISGPAYLNWILLYHMVALGRCVLHLNEQPTSACYSCSAVYRLCFDTVHTASDFVLISLCCGRSACHLRIRQHMKHSIVHRPLAPLVHLLAIMACRTPQHMTSKAVGPPQLRAVATPPLAQKH